MTDRDRRAARRSVSRLHDAARDAAKNDDPARYWTVRDQLATLATGLVPEGAVPEDDAEVREFRRAFGR